MKGHFTTTGNKEIKTISGKSYLALLALPVLDSLSAYDLDITKSVREVSYVKKYF